MHVILKEVSLSQQPVMPSHTPSPHGIEPAGVLAGIKAAEAVLSRLSAALDTLLAVLTAGDFVSDIATRTTCREVDAVAGFLRELGCPGPAAQWIDDHAATDDCGDAHCGCPTCRTPDRHAPPRPI